jgi:2-C-methyl-D-erythritol 2,4-cyclodiphosphate synthase
MNGSSLRIGHGIDAHRFVPGRPLMLGGVHIPYDRGLMGHSDGDAVAHALADACLGAAGLGDMGRHFPSTDPQWKDTAGVELLRHVAAKLREARWTLVSAHIVAVAEEPRLSPHLAGMAEALCGALGVSLGTVEVGATTTDGMGFAGRGDGVAASATVLLTPL